MNDIEVIQAIITVSEYCRGKICSSCPLSNTESGRCLFADTAPNLYNTSLLSMTEHKTILSFKERK